MKNNTLTQLLCPLVACALLAAAPAIAEEKSPGYIAVTGEAQSVQAPDMALLSLTVTRVADTARAALDANNQAMAAVIRAMRDAGIAERDLQTSDFSIQPNYVYPKPRDENPPRIAGYTVRNGLGVRVRDLGQLGAIIDTAVSLGVNEGGSVSFTNEDAAAAMETARSLAVKDAMARAATIAGAAGVKLGDILSITERSMQPPRPMLAGKSMALASEAAVPVASGENTYRVSVELRVAIEQ